MDLLDILRIGTVYTVGLYSEEEIADVTRIVMYNRQTKATFDCTSLSFPITFKSGEVNEVSWDARTTKAMIPGIYSIQVYTGEEEDLTCVLDEECVRAQTVSASN